LPAPQVTPTPTPSAAASAVQIGIGTIFFVIVVGGVLLIIFGIILYFVAKWVIKFIKRRSDFLFAVKEAHLKLCVMHSNRKLHGFRAWKNPPIRLAYPDEHGKLIVTDPIAYYGGHHYTSDGDLFIRFFEDGFRFIWFLPFLEAQLLICPSNQKIKLGGSMSSIATFSDTGCILYAHGIDQFGNRDYYLPVLMDESGKIIDLKPMVYKSIESITMGQAVTEFLETYPESIKKAVQLNPVLRAYNKVNDQNVEIESPNNPDQRPEQKR
jgi:hypothetical protein